MYQPQHASCYIQGVSNFQDWTGLASTAVSLRRRHPCHWVDANMSIHCFV